MANLQERRDKSGKLISYSIRVHRGRGPDGKQLKPWTATFEVSPTWTEKSARKKAEAFAATFEKECKEGITSDNRQKLGEYIPYVIMLKENSGAKHTTITFYQALAVRIIPALGHIKLKDLRVDHLNAFYAELGKEGSRMGATRAIAKVDLVDVLKSKGFTRAKLSEDTGVPLRGVYAAVKGESVGIEIAEKISAVLGLSLKKAFSLQENTRTLSTKSILEHHRFLHSVLQQAVKEGLVAYNVADRATPPKRVKKEVDHYEPEQISAIIEALEDEPIRWKTLVHLMLVTGCRRGELLGLKWKHVDFEKNQIYICSAISYRPDVGIYEDTPKTEKSIRYVALPSEMMKLLRQYRAWQAEERLRMGEYYQDQGFVFAQDNGQPLHPDSVTAWLTKFSKRHGLPHLHSHGFRHTAATLLLYSGVDVATVAARLGHSQVSTTLDVYSHVLEKADKKSADILGAIVHGGSRKKA